MKQRIQQVHGPNALTIQIFYNWSSSLGRVIMFFKFSLHSPSQWTLYVWCWSPGNRHFRSCFPTFSVRTPPEDFQDSWGFTEESWGFLGTKRGFWRFWGIQVMINLGTLSEILLNFSRVLQVSSKVSSCIRRSLNNYITYSNNFILGFQCIQCLTKARASRAATSGHE